MRDARPPRPPPASALAFAFIAFTRCFWENGSEGQAVPSKLPGAEHEHRMLNAPRRGGLGTCQLWVKQAAPLSSPGDGGCGHSRAELPRESSLTWRGGAGTL